MLFFNYFRKNGGKESLTRDPIRVGFRVDVGHGLSGAILSWVLKERGKSSIKTRLSSFPCKNPTNGEDSSVISLLNGVKF